MDNKKITSALISVYHKDGLGEVAQALHENGVRLISTGGTASFIKKLGFPVEEIADLTDYPSIFGGRVKTLHPKVFGGILYRRDNQGDMGEAQEYNIPAIDMVIVDLYPFQETVNLGANEEEIIEKIDIGGIALIRAAAKNHKDVVIVPSQGQYAQILDLLRTQKGNFSFEQRRKLAAEAFLVTHRYDQFIFTHFMGGKEAIVSITGQNHKLRYGENPHQKGFFTGDINKMLKKLHGKDFSYNNIQDVTDAMMVIEEFRGEDPTFAILKHTNPCGVAQGQNMLEAWRKALASDPVSAFGGILICNGKIEKDVAEEINKIFFEALIAEDFSDDALDILKQKKKRILLKQVMSGVDMHMSRVAMGGILAQDRDTLAVDPNVYETKTSRQAASSELQDIVFGEKVGKHLKSNAIAIVKDRQLIGSGVGQTSRVDALRQAIDKAGRLGFSLEGAVLYSDAFFPFADCAEISHRAGIEVLAEPGGSIRDQETINYAEANKMCVVFTKNRRFKH